MNVDYIEKYGTNQFVINFQSVFCLSDGQNTIQM